MEASMTADSTQPPETEPTTAPSARTPITAPTGRGEDPQVWVTVASAKRWPSSSHRSSVGRTSRSLDQLPDLHREFANALSGGGEDSVRGRGRHRRIADFAHPAEVAAALHDVHL